MEQGYKVCPNDTHDTFDAAESCYWNRLTGDKCSKRSGL